MSKKIGLSEFIERANRVHHDLYEYSMIRGYVNNRVKMPIICKEHGVFYQSADKHLKGQGCPMCGGTKVSDKESFIRKAIDVHGEKYDYSKVVYINSKTKVKIICPEHGEFEQTPHNHLKGQGCPRCVGKLKTTFDFVEECKAKYGEKYDYTKVDYTKNDEKVCIICKKHGEFWMTPANHLQGEECPKCSNGMHSSKFENEIKDYLESLNVKVEVSNRTILDNNNEIDLFLPEYNIGIECDGLYWHCEKFKSPTYHLSKTKECEEKGIRLIHIFEDEWSDKKELMKTMLRTFLGKLSDKIYARKCMIKQVSSPDKRSFLNANHIQGNCQSLINLGLYYNGNLVSLMTFGKPRINMGGDKTEGTWELVRFCNKSNFIVNGGASKLLKEFIKEYHPKKIVSYADKRWSTGNLYKKIGFTRIKDSKPNYFYIINNHRENRFKYRKSVLVNEGFNKNKSEHEIMLERGIYRIYDCGCKVYVREIVA